MFTFYWRRTLFFSILLQSTIEPNPSNAYHFSVFNDDYDADDELSESLEYNEDLGWEENSLEEDVWEVDDIQNLGWDEYEPIYGIGSFYYFWYEDYNFHLYQIVMYDVKVPFYYIKIPSLERSTMLFFLLFV